MIFVKLVVVLDSLQTDYWEDKMNERKMVMRRQRYIGTFNYDKLSSIKHQIDELIEYYGPDAEIRMSCEEYSDSDKEYMYVYKLVPETDDEMNSRILQEQANQVAKEEFERREFERLRAKFGTST